MVVNGQGPRLSFSLHAYLHYLTNVVLMHQAEGFPSILFRLSSYMKYQGQI